MMGAHWVWIPFPPPLSCNLIWSRNHHQAGRKPGSLNPQTRLSREPTARGDRQRPQDWKGLDPGPHMPPSHCPGGKVFWACVLTSKLKEQHCPRACRRTKGNNRASYRVIYHLCPVHLLLVLEFTWFFPQSRLSFTYTNCVCEIMSLVFWPFFF